jgi:hypothetical protein
MKKFSLKKKIAAAAAGAAIIAGAGGAYAYWTTSGAGSGSATTASSNGTLVLRATFANGLTPGAQEAVSYSADNGGSSSLQVGTITPTVSIDAAHSASCLASDFTAPPVPSNTTVLAHTTGTSVGSGTVSMADTAVNQDGCKGAIVTLTLAS